MRLGLLSDTHGHARSARAGVAALVAAGADVLIHLGDVGPDEAGTRVLEELLVRPAYVVFGNCDDARTLAADAARLGITVAHPTGRLDVDGRVVRFTHGHLEDELRAALAGPSDYVLHGHSHAVRDERRGPVRVLNPGALFRAARYTVAMLEPGIDRFELLDVPKPA